MSEYIVRNKKNVIDAHKSIHEFAMSIGRQIEKEAKVRDNKEYRKGIRSVFRKYPGMTIPKPALIAFVLRDHLHATQENYSSLVRDLEEHIRLCDGTYIEVLRGFRGGVRLKAKAK